MALVEGDVDMSKTDESDDSDLKKSPVKNDGDISEENGEKMDKMNQNEIDDDLFLDWEEEGVSDPETMRKPGVWADHLQVLKLSAHLDRPVWLFRFDDPGINLDPLGYLIPGPDFQIRTHLRGKEKSNNNSEPITLYFIPEAHYEVLKRRSNEKQFVDVFSRITVLEKIVSDKEKNFHPVEVADSLIHILFALQTDVHDIEQYFLLLNTDDVATRMDVRELMNSRRDQLTQAVTLTASLKHKLPENFLKLVEEYGGKLHASILAPLIKEVPEFSNSRYSKKISEKLSMGPLTRIIDRLKYYKENEYASETRLPYFEQLQKDLEKNSDPWNNSTHFSSIDHNKTIGTLQMKSQSTQVWNHNDTFGSSRNGFYMGKDSTQ